MSHNANYYQFVKRNLEYTKICTKKCKVLDNLIDDYISKKDSECLARCAWQLVNLKEFSDKKNEQFTRDVVYPQEKNLEVSAGNSQETEE